MIRYHKQAEKFILSQDKSTALRLYKAIELLPLGNVKRLHGHRDPPLHRLRVGNYRIVFFMEQSTINILRIDTRGDVYKML